MAPCAIKEVQNDMGNVVLTSEPLVENVDVMSKEAIAILFRKYVQFIYSMSGRDPNEDEMKAEAQFIIVKPWAYMSKNENLVNNYIELAS